MTEDVAGRVPADGEAWPGAGVAAPIRHLGRAARAPAVAPADAAGPSEGA